MTDDVDPFTATDWPTTTKTTPRPPTALTADRLTDHLTKFDRHITPAERLAMEATIAALDQIPGREAAARRTSPDH